MGVTHIELVGSYAIRLIFSSGHDTGIHSWDPLYEYSVHQEKMSQSKFGLEATVFLH